MALVIVLPLRLPLESEKYLQRGMLLVHLFAKILNSKPVICGPENFYHAYTTAFHKVLMLS